MSSFWSTQKTPTQMLEGVISPHRTLFKYYDKVKTDLASMLEKYKTLQPSMHSFARTIPFCRAEM